MAQMMLSVHPNIVTIIGVKIESNSLGYAMAVNEMGNLATFLTKSILSYEAQQKFIGELVDGLYSALSYLSYMLWEYYLILNFPSH